MFSGRECRAFPVYGATCPASGGKCRSLRRCFDGCCQGGGTRRTSVFCYRISFRSFVKEYLNSGRIGRLNFMCRGALCRNEKRGKPFLKACRARMAGVVRRLFSFADSPFVISGVPVRGRNISGIRSSLHGLRLTNTTGRVLLDGDQPVRSAPHVETQVLVAGLLRAQTGYLVADGPSVFPDGDAVDLDLPDALFRSSDHAARPGGQLGVEREQVRRVLE